MTYVARVMEIATYYILSGIRYHAYIRIQYLVELPNLRFN